LDLVKSIGAEVMAPNSGWQNEMSTPPLTLIHGDCHNENFMFSEGGDEVIAIDFQLCAVGQAAFDVANMICISTTQEDLAKEGTEQRLLAHYYNGLCEELGGKEEGGGRCSLVQPDCHCVASSVISVIKCVLRARVSACPLCPLIISHLQGGRGCAA
jgi:thiamine kinase-like enzyme